MVNIANIEKELARLWEEQKEAKQIRGCLFNLIVYAHQADRAAYFRKKIHSILEKFPCRIIFIEAKPECPLHVAVSTQATGSIACDQITITSPFDSLKRIPFIVIPHIVPDLPVYLLWGQDPTEESVVLPPLEQIASRLIFDSECTLNLQKFSQSMLQKMETSSIDFVDMNWALISVWRKALSSIFDTPDKLKRLRTSKKITIAYNCRKTEFFHHYETQALYLKAWLIAQMELRNVDFVLEPKVHEFHPSGALLIVKVEGADQFEMFLSREKEWSKAVCHICYEETCEMPYYIIMPDLERGFQFMREIFLTKPSVHYRNMLRVLSKGM